MTESPGGSPVLSPDVLPRLRSLAGALHAKLRERWPSAVVPSYPALARPGEPVARPPREWESGG